MATTKLNVRKLTDKQKKTFSTYESFKKGAKR